MKIILIDDMPLRTGHVGRGIGTYVRGLKTGFSQIQAPFKIVYASENFTKADLIHYPHFDLFWPTLPLIKRLPTVVTIHDLIPLKYPDLFPVGKRGKLSYLHQRYSLKTVKRIIAVSHACKTDLVNLFNLDESKIKVIHEGADRINKPRDREVLKDFFTKHQLPQKIFGYVGDINFNKNLPRLIEAIGRNKDHKLYIVTRADINSDIKEAVAIRQAISKFTTIGQVNFLKLDSVEELALFYNSVDWYVQPSIDEGFGLPVLEAMQSATPVLCADVPALKEVAGDAALYFDPYDVSDMAAKLDEAASIKPQQYSYSRQSATKRATQFSWADTARGLCQVYQDVLETN